MNDVDILQLSQARSNSISARDALVIFARAPCPGTVKTRLIGERLGKRVLSARDVAQLYEAMLRDTISVAKNVNDWDVILAHTPDEAFAPGEYSLRHFWLGQCSPQGEGDLAVRLSRCFRRWRIRGYEKMIVIGSDAPDLPREYLRAAFDQLDSHDLIFGPADDGGFYLIGVSCPVHTALFHGVRWSTPRVLEAILKNAARQKQSTALLDSWRDVDDADDLQAFIERLRSGESEAAATRAILAAWRAL